MVSQRLLSLAAVAAALPSGLAFSGALPSGLARARSGAPARRVAPSAMLPDAHAFAATLPPAASAALGDALGGSTLALAKTPYGPTCMDEGGPWCGWQNFVQGTIVNLHGVIDGESSSSSPPSSSSSSPRFLSVRVFPSACRHRR